MHLKGWYVMTYNVNSTGVLGAWMSQDLFTDSFHRIKHNKESGYCCFPLW